MAEWKLAEGPGTGERLSGGPVPSVVSPVPHDHLKTATTFSTLLNSRHHPFNGSRRSAARGGASDLPYTP
ncbi:hypothetical protein DTO212C5_7511 [Paecilomyces variotii]|nr:hypothetical protein DTO212C5_7511 [Paecilomyces variotii]